MASQSTPQAGQPGVLSPEDLAQFDALTFDPNTNANATATATAAAAAGPEENQTHNQNVGNSGIANEQGAGHSTAPAAGHATAPAAGHATAPAAGHPTATAASAPHNAYGSYLVGAPDTASAFASRNPQAPKNPYNPFLQQAAAPAPGAQQPLQQPAVGATPVVAPPAAAPTGAAAEPKNWATKDIIFDGQERKIVMQNENGPCSLLAIANILLLRGDVTLAPPDRPLVNYEYLSSLIAEYLLTRPDGGANTSLDGALALLPQTQHGLNLNPSFLTNDGFVTSDDASQQIALFNLLGIKLYHGFVPDSSSPAEYELARMAGSYDAAVDQVVRGEEVAARFFKEAQGQADVSAALKQLKSRGGYAVVESSGWGTALQRQTIEQALSLSDFLESNSSQLTYPGLFALSALPEGTLAALFRFNHLSVFYRPRSGDAQAAADGAAATSSPTPPPSLLTLITADAFLDDELAVWETLADVDGRDSGDIYDSRLRRRPAARGRGAFGAGGDEITADGQHAPLNGGSNSNEDADYALALQLHSEERDRAERRRAARQSQQQQQERPRHAYSHRGWSGRNNSSGGVGGGEDNARGGSSSSSSSGGGFKNLLSSIGLGKKNKNKSGGGSAGGGGDGGSAAAGGATTGN